MGLETADDAGVYRLSADLALIQTVDFFTPIVDDPYLFGKIAAANALSDVYAMGGRPICALNIVGFPIGTMEISVLREILRGGIDVLKEAGAVLAGGHTVADPELKYGMSVTGVVHPDRVMTNRGGRPGDRLLLTKPIGTGVINTAVKAGKAPPDVAAAAVESMCALNRTAAEVLKAFDVHACTDVTGFGLLGHACEMIENSDTGLWIDAAAVPLLPSAREYAAAGMIPGGLRRNRSYREKLVEIGEAVPADLADLLYDPQTSGGLMAAVAEPDVAGALRALIAKGLTASVIGRFTVESPGRIRVSISGAD